MHFFLIYLGHLNPSPVYHPNGLMHMVLKIKLSCKQLVDDCFVHGRRVQHADLVFIHIFIIVSSYHALCQII